MADKKKAPTTQKGKPTGKKAGGKKELSMDDLSKVAGGKKTVRSAKLP